MVRRGGRRSKAGKTVAELDSAREEANLAGNSREGAERELLQASLSAAAAEEGTR